MDFSSSIPGKYIKEVDIIKIRIPANQEKIK